ncbi:MAG: alpha-hydroxy acid oxidase [Acidobacteriota bacterium]
MNQALARRRFLEFLAASPLLAQQPPAKDTGMQDIFNVMDFEPRAKAAIAPAHWGYLRTGVDDDLTLRANRAAFDRLFLRPRRMVDVSKLDSSIELFGQKWPTPIVLAPAGSQKAYHPEGEAAVARAATRLNHLQILSTVTSTPIEDIAKIHRRPIWYQLYPTSIWDNTERMVRRAEAAGCPVLVITVDTQGGRNTETEARSVALDPRPCSACHPVTSDGRRGRRMMPMFQGFQTQEFTVHNPAQTWDSIRRYRQLTSMKLILKGLETAEDARLAVEHGVDGIVVSNHGGRAAESGRGTLDVLPEVMDATAGRLPVLIDGGFRRGTDIFKAMALGASAVCIGRPYLWALGAFGEAGVARVLEILTAEFRLAMTQCGTIHIAAISKSLVGYHSR